MDLGLKDKVIVVTGGGSGIGAAITSTLCQEGAHVVILTRDAPDPAWLAQQKGAAEVIVVELSDDDHCLQAVSKIRATYGRIDGLVNNAGANDNLDLSTPPAAFRKSLDQNLVQCYHLVHLMANDLRSSHGAIVNISSKTALTGQGQSSAYVAAKAALLGLTREWAAAFLNDGVRVNALIPAEVMTPLYETWLQNFPGPKARLSQITRHIPLGRRMTTPQEMANTAVFLLSPCSSHTTGQWICVDGGYTHLDRALDIL